MFKTICHLLLLILIAGCTQQQTLQIQVSDGWIAEVPPGIQVTAALMTITNPSSEDAYLLEASSPIAKRIEIHRSILVNELAKMRRQDEIIIPANDSVLFNSDTGYHLMLYGVDRPERGTTIPVTLTFKSGHQITTDFEVRKR